MEAEAKVRDLSYPGTCRIYARQQPHPKRMSCPVLMCCLLLSCMLAVQSEQAARSREMHATLEAAHRLLQESVSTLKAQVAQLEQRVSFAWLQETNKGKLLSLQRQLPLTPCSMGSTRRRTLQACDICMCCCVLRAPFTVGPAAR